MDATQEGRKYTSPLTGTPRASDFCMSNPSTKPAPQADAPPTSEAKVTLGSRLLATGVVSLASDHSGACFTPTDGESHEDIPRNGASLTLWGSEAAVSIVDVVPCEVDGKRGFRFTLASH